MRFFTLLFAMSFAFMNVYGQKKELKISDPYTNGEVYPHYVSQLQWIPGQKAFTFVENDTLRKETVKGEKSNLLSLAELNKDFKAAGFGINKRMPSLIWVDVNTMELVRRDSIFHYNLQAHSVTFINLHKVRAEYVKRNAKNEVAFTKGNNLYIYSKDKEIAVTNDTEPGIVNGQTVSRSEFGITHGIFWSPKGNHLAFYKKDERNVTNYPLVDIGARVAEVKNTRYPMAGMDTEIIKVCVYNVATKQTVTLETGNPQTQYLTNVTWGPNEEYIYIAVLNRGQNHMKLNKYDAKTGKLVKTLFEEKNERYVEPEAGVHFFSSNPNEFIWESERDGFNHLYLYDTEGNMKKQLTKGDWEVTSILGYNEKKKKLYFMSTKESPIQRHMYELDMKKLGVNKLTGVHGTHRVDWNDDYSYFIDVYSNYTEIAREYALFDKKGQQVRIIKENHNPLEDYNLGEMTISTLKADDGTDLYYRLIKPANFDPKKKYPVIVYVYGGPHAQLVKDTWLGGSGFFLQHLAAQGYVVFTLDNRGSAHRGFEFESVIHRQLGQVEMRDQMKGIEFLKSLDYVDANRIGVDGWSFGGFMTTSLMVNHSDVFKVGCAGGPVIDWKYYEIMYGERYMDTPEENPEGYEMTSLLGRTKDLQGRLMIIHGAQDPTVVWQHSLRFVEECVNNQVLLDYFVYPDHEHNVRGYDRLHLERKILQYFNDHL
jgi:dipeptidyl-peptidase-4